MALSTVMGISCSPSSTAGSLRPLQLRAKRSGLYSDAAAEQGAAQVCGCGRQVPVNTLRKARYVLPIPSASVIYESPSSRRLFSLEHSSVSCSFAGDLSKPVEFRVLETHEKLSAIEAAIAPYIAKE